jgi:EAL domain-containing protein (putative c-di-GMP-specific phosphodiesterase class I)/GGDEF domain-containing protein
MIKSIDQKNITDINSPFSIRSSYYIDTTNNMPVENVLLKADFIDSKLNEIPYALADQSYWIKLTLHYPVHDKLLSYVETSKQNSKSFLKSSSLAEIILMAEHSMLKTFEVYSLDSLAATNMIFSQKFQPKEVSRQVYPYTSLKLNPFGQSKFLIHVKNSGPPNIPLLMFEPNDFEQRLMLSQLVYGAFIGILLIMAIYNLVLFFAAKDKVYLLYIGYLLSAFVILSSLTGYGYFLFSNEIMQQLNQYSIFFHFLLIIFLLLFTLYFLRYERLNHWAFKTSLALVVIMAVIALYSLFLDELDQAKAFFSLQPIFYIVALYLIINRLKQDFSWARFYFISWLPLLIGAAIQPMVLLNKLEYSFLTRNAFLFAIMIEVTFMAFALAERIRRYEKEKINMIAYHQSNHLPRKTNLDHSITQALKNKIDDLTVVVIKPEQFNRIELYIDEQTRINFFQRFNHKLSSVFRFNDAVLSLTDQNEKLCFLENNSLVLVINNRLNQQDIALIVQSIQDTASDVFYLKNLKLPLSAYVGLANYPEHGNSSDTLVENASQAAKNAELCQSKWVFYAAQDNQHSPSSMQLAIELQHAIANHGFELFHQPQVDLKTNKVCSSECLIRWNHPTLGFISPDVFIPIAEDFGLMPTLTRWIMATALQQQVILSEQTGFNHMVSINISGKDLVQPDFIGTVAEIISCVDIKAEKIIFELTESISFAEDSIAVKTIEKLIELGITISIDDFGTGYSSMSQISHLPFQELKIDREFVENVCSDKKRKIIAETTVKMAKGLNLEVVAEGINSALDEETLRQFGCDIGQGYYYAKPMSHQDYLSWLATLVNGQIPASLEGEFIPAEK